MAYAMSYEFMRNFGFDANKVLFDACAALDIKAFKQTYQLYNLTNETKSDGLLVFIDDEKYDLKAFGFSDVCLDAFISGDLSFNMFFVPLKTIDSLKIKAGNEVFRFSPEERIGLFYSNNENNKDISEFSDNFGFDKKELIEVKNADFLSDEQLFKILKTISHETILNIKQIQKINRQTRSNFFAFKQNEFDARNAIKQKANEFLNMKIVKDNQNSTFDCATFVMYLFMSELGIDITKSGIGNSLTGKIMSSEIGDVSLIDERTSSGKKIDFVLKNAKIGDILLFHRQSKDSSVVEENNWFPGHVGVYVGDGKYIDARHRRGDVSLVDMNEDLYMDCFIGFKDIVSSYFKGFEMIQNENG